MDDGYIDGTGDDKSGHKCNGALRGFKGGLYEGGHRVPFLVRWPAKLPAGQTRDQLVCHVDMLATVAAIVNKPLPKEAGPDSFSMYAGMPGTEPANPRPFLVYQAGGGALALRYDKWVYIPNEGKKKAGPELYDLKSDPAQAKNIAAQRPDMVKELGGMLQKAKEMPGTRYVR
jgi:arylsulfatase A-like enzyme